jgi:hypothetical protein
VPIDELLYGADGYDVRVELPASTRVNPPLSSVDVSRLPGARVVALADFREGPLVAWAGCVRGPSSRFASGLEGVLFDRAQGVALAAVPGKDVRVTREAALDRSSVRRAEGTSERGPLVVDQVLAFEGPERDLLLCSVVCAGAGCEDARVRFDGSLPEPPAPNLVVRAFFYTAENPFPVLGAATAVLVAIVVFVLWRRPYPRP